VAVGERKQEEAGDKCRRCLVRFILQNYWDDEINVEERRRACGTHGKIINASRSLFGKPGRMRETGRLEPRYEVNITMGLEEMEFEDMNWIVTYAAHSTLKPVPTLLQLGQKAVTV
jgi:hypothetical protein